MHVHPRDCAGGMSDKLHASVRVSITEVDIRQPSSYSATSATASTSTRNSRRASPMAMATVIAGGSGHLPQIFLNASKPGWRGLSGDDADVPLDDVLEVKPAASSAVCRFARAGHDDEGCGAG